MRPGFAPQGIPGPISSQATSGAPHMQGYNQGGGPPGIISGSQGMRAILTPLSKASTDPCWHQIFLSWQLKAILVSFYKEIICPTQISSIGRIAIRCLFSNPKSDVYVHQRVFTASCRLQCASQPKTGSWPTALQFRRSGAQSAR